MPQTVHCHNFDGKTTLSLRHRHGLSGVTSEEPNQPGHTHKITGHMTFNHGHKHYYNITTEPELAVEDGHIHYYQGTACDSHNHLHFVYGYTSVSR